MNKFHKSNRHNELATKLISRLSENTEVLTIFVSGSTITGGRDEYSDVDINIVVRNPEEFKKTIVSIANEIDTVTHHFCPPRLDFIYVLYFKNLEKIDIGIYSEEEFLSEQHVAPDEKAVIKNTIEKTKQKSVSQTPADSSFQNKFLALALADIIAIPREVYRRNIFEARSNLDESRSMIATYLNIQNSIIYFGFNDFINFANPKQKELFISSLKKNGSYKGILTAARKLLKVIATTGVYKESLIKLVDTRIVKVLKSLKS
jgi:predicted nucleotidyltransferase